jgi:hypothetical protein
MTHKALWAAVALTGWLGAAPAHAEPSEPSAYENMLSGLAAYDQKHYAEAAELLSSALAEYPLPTVAYYAGQAYENQGKLLEAANMYRRAEGLSPSGAGKDLLTQKKAQQDASEALGRLDARIPALTVTVQSASPENVSVTLDGAPLAAESLGQPQPINPGAHELVGRCREEPSEPAVAVTLVEGQKQAFDLSVACQPLAPVEPQPPPPKPAAPPPPPPRTAPEPRGNSLKSTAGTAGWIGLGVGGAAVTLWAVTGLVALNKKGGLRDDGCTEQLDCDARLRSRVDSYNRLRDVSAVGFWVGVPLLAAGAGALWWSKTPDEPAPDRAGMTAWVGLGQAGVRGRFY